MFLAASNHQPKEHWLSRDCDHTTLNLFLSVLFIYCGLFSTYLHIFEADFICQILSYNSSWLWRTVCTSRSLIYKLFSSSFCMYYYLRNGPYKSPAQIYCATHANEYLLFGILANQIKVFFISCKLNTLTKCQNTVKDYRYIERIMLHTA